MVEVDFAKMRAAMVASQLRTSDVNDRAVIAAMSAVPREDFVPVARRATAYIDRAIPIGDGRAINPPMVTGRLLVAADVRPGEKVLLVGDSCGYMTALLAHLGADVTRWDEGAAGKGGSTYDVLIVDGAIEQLPLALEKVLKDGGRVALGLIDRGVATLCSGSKAGGSIGYTRLGEMEMAVVPGFEKARSFAF